MKPLLVLLSFSGAVWVSAHAQSTSSVALGVGTVRYAGGSNQNSVSLTPELGAGGSAWSASLAGTFATLPGADWYSQARGSFWGAAPVAGHFRLGGDINAIGTWIVPHSLKSNSAEGRLTVEGLWSGRRWGVGLGGGLGVGWIEALTDTLADSQVVASDSQVVTTGRGRVRAWWDPTAAVGLAATVEPTYLLGGWYTDVGFGLTGRRDPLTLTVWVTGRLSAVYESSGAASAELEWRMKPFLTLAVGGGSYLPNPYQGFPAGTFFTAAIQLHAPPPVAHAGRDSTRALSPLVPAKRGDTLVVRFAMPKAASVAIAGDWNTWTPDTLHRVGSDIWEATLLLHPGTYHFNLLVDGKDWVLPGGVATVPDGLGGRVAVLLVF